MQKIGLLSPYGIKKQKNGGYLCLTQAHLIILMF